MIRYLWKINNRNHKINTVRLNKNQRKFKTNCSADSFIFPFINFIK